MTECVNDNEKCHIQPIKCPKCKEELYGEALKKFGDKLENAIFGEVAQ